MPHDVLKIRLRGSLDLDLADTSRKQARSS